AHGGRGAQPGLQPAHLPRGHALDHGRARRVQADAGLPCAHLRRRHSAPVPGWHLRGDAEGRLLAQAARARGAHRPAAAARRAQAAGEGARAQRELPPRHAAVRGGRARAERRQDLRARADGRAAGLGLRGDEGSRVKILVTGGTGFLGAHLVPLLTQAGHQVRVIGRSPPPAAWTNVQYIKGDLRERDLVRTAIDGVEAIYHLAGLVSFKPDDGRKMYELHVDCTRELLRDVRALGQRPRIILASTSGTIAVSREERTGTEADDYPIEVVGRWPYYLSKIYEEKLALDYCRKNEIPLVVLNPSLLMGPGDDRLSS